MRNHTLPAVHAVFLTVCFFLFSGFSRPASRTAEVPRSFEITVREVHSESGHSGRAGAAARPESRSTLSHFGRIEAERGGKAPRASDEHTAAVFTDSLLFRSEAPFRFVARLSRDTIQVTSAENKPAAQMGGIESDEIMLRCIFEGPALRIRLPAGDAPAPPIIENLKPDCPGGLYRRLHLPTTIGVFVMAPAGGDQAEKKWQSIVTCPSFSGLGFFPQILWAYTPTEHGRSDGASAIGIACDTTLSAVRATMANGETIDIIADRITVRGTLKPWRELPFFYEGKIEIREEIKYVRPAIGPDVLDKRCESEITLAPR
jgi:hypothetical protein